MSLTVTINILGNPTATIDDVPYQSGINVQQVMQAAYDADPAARSTLAFDVEYFGSSLGYELTTLDGICGQAGGDGETYLFWELLINGQPSPTGIDQTYPADGDTVQWNYTTYSPEHTGTRREAIRNLIQRR